MQIFTKNKNIRAIALILAFASLASFSIQAQTLKRHVIGSAGGSAKSGNAQIKCTYGQTFVGRFNGDNLNRGIGFWYSLWNDAQAPMAVAVLVTPDTSAEIGAKISIPLILQEVRNFDSIKGKTYIAKIRYNSTILQADGFIPEIIPNSEECYATLTGIMPEKAGNIASLNFVARMGSVSNTKLTIDTFYCAETSKLEVHSQSGEFQLLGLCDEGGTTRTVKKGLPGGIYAISPNPSEGYSLINYTLGEKGAYKISLVSVLGVESAVLGSGQADVGKYNILADFSQVPSGVYYITLSTHTERFAEKIVINK